MPTRKFIAAAVLALLALTAPAHAAYVSNLDANVDLNFGPAQELTGNINLTLNTPYVAAHLGPWQFSGDLSLNSTPLTDTFIEPAFRVGVPGTMAILSGGGGLVDFLVNTAYLSPNPTYLDFGLGPVYDASFHYTATGGTVTVLSETLATPLPNALPLFGSALFALAGFAAWSRRVARG